MTRRCPLREPELLVLSAKQVNNRKVPFSKFTEVERKQ